MELSFESILETILVGSLASLCVVTLVFLLVPDFIRVPTIRALFRYFLYEDEAAVERPSKLHLPSPGQAINIEEGPAKVKESVSLFAAVLLCAGLYGAGIVSESLSDRLTRVPVALGAFSGLAFSDPEIRIEAFDKVGSAALVSEHVPRQFQEFMTDYRTCHDSGLLRSSEFSPTCRSMQARAMAFYYDAKNLVFREESYFEELSKLQRRINFTRAMGTAFLVLFALLTIGCCIAVAFETAHRLKERDPSRWFKPLASVYARAQASKALGNHIDHWENLAEGRMLLMALVALCAAMASQEAWRDNEDEFDRRVFGYFLSMTVEKSTVDQGGREESKSGEFRVSNSGAGPERILPRSTYRTFESNQASRFEPSAVVALNGGSRVLVANDKSDPSLVVFIFDENGGLEEHTSLDDAVVNAFSPSHSTGEPRSSFPLVKIEALDAAPLGDEHVIYAATSFDRADPNNRRVVSFSLAANSTVSNFQVHNLDPDPCVLATNRTEGPGSCVIEGLASTLRENTAELLLGVRFVGSGRTPTMMVLRYRQAGSVWSGSVLWRVDLPSSIKNKSNPFAGSGTSALELAADGSLLVLTSRETDELPGKASQVGGALWRIPAEEVLSGPTRPVWDWTDSGEHLPYLVNVFTHKPEGVAVLDNGSMVVVFDDDGKRKSRRYAPETFALDQNQGVFTVIRPLPNP